MFIEDYYASYDEDSRLTSRHGSVEYITTMKYVHEYLKPGMRVLEIGAATGRYSLALAHEGFKVDAVELVQSNLDKLLSAISPGDDIRAVQGNALDLAMYKSETFDVTLCLGPLYHLYTEADMLRALSEAVRVTKKGGTIMAAYCMNEATMVTFCFRDGHIGECVENHMLTEDFHTISEPKDLFKMVRTEEIAALNAKLPATPVNLIATDGAAFYMRNALDEMDDATFDMFMKYHLAICERADLIGATAHSLSILRKN